MGPLEAEIYEILRGQVQLSDWVLKMATDPGFDPDTPSGRDQLSLAFQSARGLNAACLRLAAAIDALQAEPPPD